MKEAKEKVSNSGLSSLLDIRKFSNYEVKEDYQKTIKNKAIEFTKDFIKNKNKSFSILGQSGVGKSHIMIAVSSELIKRNIEVKYYTSDEITQKLQSCKFDAENYNKVFGEIANASVLFVDDLFKSSIKNYYNEESIDVSDFKEVFNVINYRYNKNKPILLSSELHFERFADLDQALVGRINEMCDYEYLISIKPDREKNYRLKNRRKS